MPRIPSPRHSVIIACRTCPNYCVLPADTYLPPGWTCPVCEDALEQQMVEALAFDTRNRCEPELTKEN